MSFKAISLAAILGAGLFVLAGQQPAASGIFTSAQAEAGRTAYERTCGQCHTSTLLGRKGDPGELPPVSSLPAHWQKFIGPRGFVAPLTGNVFIDRWGGKTSAELIARFQETVDDPVLKFEGLNYRQYYRIHPSGQWCEARNSDADQNDRCRRQIGNSTITL